MNYLFSPGFIVAAVTAAVFVLSVSADRAEGADEARFLPTLEEIQRLSPGWFDEVRDDGTGRGSTFRVYQGWRKVPGAPQGERADVLLSVTIRPRPAPALPWGPAVWRKDFEQKQALIHRVPDLQVREIDLGSFAYLVTRAGGNHVEVTFFTESWRVTVHNGTEETRLSYPAEAHALRVARWLLSRLSHENPAK